MIPEPDAQDVATVRAGIQSGYNEGDDPYDCSAENRCGSCVGCEADAALDRLEARLQKLTIALEGERSGARIDFARAEAAEAKLQKAERERDARQQEVDEFRVVHARMATDWSDAVRARDGWADRAQTAEARLREANGTIEMLSSTHSERERAIGYGTYRDPRFLPVALKPDARASDESEVIPSSRPELWSSAAQGIGREGIFTVWDSQGAYVGCVGVETWKREVASDESGEALGSRS